MSSHITARSGLKLYQNSKLIIFACKCLAYAQLTPNFSANQTTAYLPWQLPGTGNTSSIAVQTLFTLHLKTSPQMEYVDNLRPV